MPRRRRPSREKKLRGRPAGGSGLAGELVRDPKAPEWLTDAVALGYFRRRAAELAEAGVLATSDIDQLAHLASIHAALVRTWNSGETPKASLVTQFRLLATEFGLTPASRGKPARAAEPDEEDPAARFFLGPEAVT